MLDKCCIIFILFFNSVSQSLMVVIYILINGGVSFWLDCCLGVTEE